MSYTGAAQCRSTDFLQNPHVTFSRALVRREGSSMGLIKRIVRNVKEGTNGEEGKEQRGKEEREVM